MILIDIIVTCGQVFTFFKMFYKFFLKFYNLEVMDLFFRIFIVQLAGIKRQSKSLSLYYEELKNVDYKKMKIVF